MSYPSRNTRQRARALRHQSIDNPTFASQAVENTSVDFNAEFASSTSDAPNPVQVGHTSVSEYDDPDAGSSTSDDPNPVQVDDIDASDDETIWEDVMLDVQREGDNETRRPRRDVLSASALRRQLNGNSRRRKRAGSTHTPLRKSGINSVPTGSDGSPTPTRFKSLPPFLVQEGPRNISLEAVNHKLTRPKPKPIRRPSVQMPSADDLAYNTVEGIYFGGWYIFDVTRTALALLRKPLGVILFLWLLAMILSSISHTLRAAFAPICWLPFISSSLMCRPIPPPPTVNYPILIDAETKTFEQLLDESSGGSALSLEVKKAEIATSDLITLVRISKLPSGDILAGMLSDFVQDAKTTGKRLHKLHSKVGGSVDVIMAVNGHALRTIEEANRKNSVISFDSLIPWGTSRKQRVMTSTFNDAMDTLSNQISRLILEAEANIQNLNDLEERLNALHELASREALTVKGDREELLAQLWTILGGNRKELKNFSENLAILKNVGMYRQQARVHVTATLQTLESLSEDMEDLRERVATPGLVGESIPLEVQMQSIQFGLERLKENRLRARRVHDKAVDEITGSAPMMNLIT